ncbi:hypothetical protein N7533_000807 [Penicillium manginii]|uniref:uncharacterized protein n=1 Tax=Penicillium manginii TaxID=203109 RepID=UPI002547001A|nr:uncharacterized protein N7533_000807 [Penicillium manginii]KAJ5768224.1 hypothetical protein N7533_000807 [Penicillium manginii]
MDGRSRAADATWEEKSKIFASKRDALIHQYKELRREVAATSKNRPATSSERPGDNQDLVESMNDLFLKTLHLLYTLNQVGIDDTATGLCFRPKMRILRFIIEGVVGTDSLRLADHRGVLDIVATHFGRLTLDPNGLWDETADQMDNKADKVFKHYLGLAEDAIYRFRRSEILGRDLRWFHDCWRLVTWYEPNCDCLQCTFRAHCAFREVCWEENDYEMITRAIISSGVETLDPLEIWKVEMNDRLGETY